MRAEVTSFLRRSVRVAPSGVAVVSPDGEQTNADLMSQVNELSAHFHQPLPILLELQGMRGDRYVSTTRVFFFGAQALWPAVAMRLPVTFIVLDNGGFGSTKMFEERYTKEHPRAAMGAAHFVGSDFSASGLSVRDVVEGFGVPVVSLEFGDMLEEKLDKNSGPGPVLLHVAVVG